MHILKSARNTHGKQNAVIIIHPEFQGGREGLNAAKEYAERMVEGAQVLEKEAVKNGEDAEAIRAYLGAFKYVVRALDEDLL